jgi:tetratricopeptide (TPR) repeat protein
MIRERCQLAESDDEATTRAKVGQAVAQWVSDPEEAAWIERSLLTLLGVEQGMAADQLFGAWRTFFERIAEQGTVVLAFEDMHFADTGLLDFVDHLLEWSRGMPIYVVTLARPDLIERRPSWGAGKRNFVSLYLEPLPEADMRQLLTALVPGLPEKAVATIVGRADGIPMYAVETVRMLVAEGRLVEEAGVYVPRGDLTTLAVPETLTALIASRLDALDETERRIVHDAAVIGQSFTLGALSAVAGVAESELEPKLASLVRRELLQREMDARSPERGQYAFVQALIREVAYNTLSKKDRKKLHLAAARYFESLGNDELAGVLASHYLAAHGNAAEPAEAEALAAQARIALKAAATRASALGSFDQAVGFAEQALTVTSDPADRAELLLQAAQDAQVAGRLEHTEELARTALEFARGEGRRDLAAQAIEVLGEVVVSQFRNDEAQVLLESALDEFGDGDPAVLARIRLWLARVYYGKSDYATARDIVEHVLETAEPLGLVAIVARGLLMRGNVLWSLRRRREAYAVAEAAERLAAENGLVEIQIRSMSTLANALQETDAAAAAARWREVLALSRKVGMRGLLIGGVGNFAYTAFVSGDWAEGLAEMDNFLAEDVSARDRLIMLNNALIIRASLGEPVEEGLAEMRRLTADMSGQSQLFLADPEANHALATGELRKARDAYMVIVDADPGQPEYAYRAARASLWGRDLSDATELLARVEQSGAYGPVQDARVAAVRAGIAALDGRTAEALALYRDALRGFRETHSILDEAMTGIDMTELLDPSEPEVAATTKSTREILERLGAKPYLERLDSAAGRAPARAARTTRSATIPEGAVSE